jgi:hypothetical protein
MRHHCPTPDWPGDCSRVALEFPTLLRFIPLPSCDARQRAVAYSWELSGGHSLWWVVFMQAGAAGEMEWSHWRGFFVAFDSNNIVTVAAHKNLSSRKSLHEQLETWARKNHAASDLMHPETFLAQTP